MVDQRGREALLGLLSGLTERHRMGLVHITHYRNEADNADRIINLSASADNMVMVAPVHSSGPAAAPTAGPPRDRTGHDRGPGGEAQRAGAPTRRRRTRVRDGNSVVQDRFA